MYSSLASASAAAAAVVVVVNTWAEGLAAPTFAQATVRAPVQLSAWASAWRLASASATASALAVLALVEPALMVQMTPLLQPAVVQAPVVQSAALSQQSFDTFGQHSPKIHFGDLKSRSPSAIVLKSANP